MKMKRFYPEVYKKRLAAAMRQAGVTEYSFDYSTSGAWVQFTYGSQQYRLEHSVDGATSNGQPILTGSDAFCQIVLTLEDLVHAADRGVRNLQTWVEGIKDISWPDVFPDCFRWLGFQSLPASAAEIDDAFEEAAKSVASSGEYEQLIGFCDACMDYLADRRAFQRSNEGLDADSAR